MTSNLVLEERLVNGDCPGNCEIFSTLPPPRSPGSARAAGAGFTAIDRGLVYGIEDRGEILHKLPLADAPHFAAL